MWKQVYNRVHFIPSTEGEISMLIGSLDFSHKERDTISIEK